MLTIFLVLALGGYLAGALFILQQVVKEHSQLGRYAWLATGLAIISHGVLIGNEIAIDQFQHVNIILSLSCVAWVIALLSQLRGSQSSNLLLQPVIFLFAALTCLLLAFAPADWGANLDMNVGLLVHIVLSLCAYGVLALATLYAIQAAYVSNVLKQRKSTSLFSKLPPLLSVERYFFRLLFTGTILLLLSLASGFAFLNDMFAQHVAHKTILSIAAAVVYLVANIMHRVTGSRGKVMVFLTILGSVLLTLGYFGSRFVKDVLLT